ncbi:radical SAM protein [Thauera sp.]|jgi:wyosine [tRNA(Phe)-imidazoG37] synthetase (radical SAM superfamily)|uniref:radical SAM protein n=1 Tax=Thauera sp. TaxID=1905334 RepID=UPI002A3674B9|nr:radical SAM protein [Thauera sp.]MDX9885356.1 radical SAM protein [Thauera sp.]
MNSSIPHAAGSAAALTIRNHDRDLAGLTYVYPVLSRRAGGVSVGINLNPNNACNWHCVYCQVPDLVRGKAPAIDLAQLEDELRGFLGDLVHGGWMARFVPEGLRVIRDIAFSGNGEPTSAVVFPEAVALVLRLRAEFGLSSAEVPLRLITNGSLIGQARVQEGVRLLGEAGGEVWFKVDGGTADAIERINGVRLEPESIARNLARCAQLCPTWVQTCMFRWDGEAPSAAELDAYLAVLEAAGIDALQGVLLYGIARQSMQPEAVRLAPLAGDELESIAAYIRKKGLTVRVSP